jgi:hypothetical protein
MGVMKNAYKIVRKPDGKKPIWRPWCKWEDNTEKDLKRNGM